MPTLTITISKNSKPLFLVYRPGREAASGCDESPSPAVRLPKNAEMREEINKPIFVVGSPRSGTSILTWCLGQHPNMFPVPESNWMGEFALNIASSYQIGAARDNRTILSAMDISRAEFFVNFGHAINHLILGHRSHLERKRDLEGTLNTKHSTS